MDFWTVVAILVIIVALVAIGSLMIEYLNKDKKTSPTIEPEDDICHHDWDMWEQVEGEDEQRRKCKKCGFIQRAYMRLNYGVEG